MSPMRDESVLMQEENMRKVSTTKKEVNKGAWTAEEDRILAEVIAIHGAKKWKTVAAKSGRILEFNPNPGMRHKCLII